MFYPYVIMRLKQVNQDEADPQLAEDFLILESFVMRRKISTRGTHDYTKKCYEIIKKGILSLTLLCLTQEAVEQAENDPVWDEAHIEARKASLYEEFIALWPSFSDRVTTPERAGAEENSDPVLENFTNEQFDNAAMLLEAIPVPSSASETEGTPEGAYLTQAELTRHINVQHETVERCIREGRIIPDRVEQISECRSVNYFLDEKLPQYAEEFGWVVIDGKNRKNVFMDMVRKMKISCSYKPIFLKSLLKHADTSGAVSVSHLIADFRSFYDARRAAGLIVEKGDSVYMDAQISDDDILRNILIYPFRRFEDIGAVLYNSDQGEIVVDRLIWDAPSEAEKAEIVEICGRKLEEYYAELSRQESTGH